MFRKTNSMYKYKHLEKLSETQKFEVKKLTLRYLNNTHPNEIIPIGNGMSFSARNLISEVKENTKYGLIFIDFYFDENLLTQEPIVNNHPFDIFILATVMYLYFWYECNYKKLETC